MKKFLLILPVIMLCLSCRANRSMQPRNDVMAYPAATDMAPAVPAGDLELSEYRQHVVVKASGADFIVYEYSDIRIDKVATLASHFCYETNPGKSAYLRDIYMNKNRKRRATFDCVDLATK